MKQYDVTVRIYAFMTVRVEAEDADAAAYDTDLPNVYCDSQRGLSVSDPDARLYVSDDAFDIDSIEVVEVSE